MVNDQSGSGGGKYSAGGVSSSSKRLIADRSSTISTNNALDLAVKGAGMLPVTQAARLDNSGEPQGPIEMLMTTTGSFSPDANGIVTTSTGLVLLGWPANSDGAIPVATRDTVDNLKPIIIKDNEKVSSPTTHISLGVNLPATETSAGASGDTIPMSVEYFGNLGTLEKLQLNFTPNIPATGTSNSWRMTVFDNATGPAALGTYDITFNNGRINGGSIANIATLNGPAYAPTTGAINLTLAGGPMSLELGRLNGDTGITQFASDFSPKTLSKNGSPSAKLIDVKVDENGYVRANYDSGLVRTLYQIPLAAVPNENGLTAHSAGAYSVSPDSGSFFLWDAGQGPTSGIASFSLEQSSTDIAQELTELIQTQRAYSSNAKIIQTVDEMYQETTNIKR